MNKNFYITTPLYYVNDKPHMGSAYSTINADILNRYFKLFGYDTYFLTGTDEHGQKVETAAKARKLDPQAHCDEMAENFKSVWSQMNIHYDVFFRTTDSEHKSTVQKALQSLFDKGEIYEDTYEGWYCVSDETFHTEKELVDGKSPSGKEVVKIQEKNYFFKMSQYQDKLIGHIESNPKFIQPESRKNEVLGFLKQPLNDLCISRPKARLSWGVELPFDTDYVTYVWFDALLNYTNAVGFLNDSESEKFNKYWSAAHHILGKDIVTTHAVYWPTMLMALGVELPQTIFAHGWLLNKDSQKMSKSFGDVMNPIEVAEKVGVDSLRYFLARDIHFGNDSPISEDLIVNRINTELANNFGNMLSRTTNLIAKYFEGHIPPQTDSDVETEALKKLAIETADKVRKDIESFAPSYALEHIVNLLTEANKFLENKAPWKQAKEDLPAAGKSLYTALEVIRISAILLAPVMPHKTDQLLKSIGVNTVQFEDSKKWGLIDGKFKIEKSAPLFPRFNT